MNGEHKVDRAPPKHWQDFEDQCLKLWRPRLVDAKKNGRGGQQQAGVDVFGREPKSGDWWGIQCKQRTRWPPRALTVGEIEQEVAQAEGFKPKLAHFIVATTAARDAKTQTFVRQLSDRRRAQGKFSVDLYAWDDIQEWLQEGPEPISQEKALWLWRDRVLRLHRRLMPYFHERRAPLLEHVYVELQLEGSAVDLRTAGRRPGPGGPARGRDPWVSGAKSQARRPGVSARRAR